MQRLAPKLAAWLEVFNTLLKDLEADGFIPTPTNAREGLANLTWSLVKKRPDVSWVQDHIVKGEEFNVPIRIYHPQPEKPLPVLLYFHGGGHMAGSITVYDPICRKIALATKHVVISTDYRLAPECPYPAGITDALNVTRNLFTTLDQRDVNYIPRLSIGGDSAGGAICATVAHTLQHVSKVRIDKQILIYPSLDYTMQSASITSNGKGYLLQKERIEYYFQNYFRGGEDRREASPLYMEFSENLPESLVITAEFCPLRDEGYAYVHKLKDTGITTSHLHFKDMVHAFMNMESLVKERCDELYSTMDNFLNR